MARSFNGSTQFLSRVDAVLTGTPITMAAWVKLDTLTTNPAILSLSDIDVDDQYFMLRIFNTGVVQALVNGQAAQTTDLMSTGVWTHIAAVFASSTSRSAFLNGGSKVTHTVNLTPVGLDRTSVARSGRSIVTNLADGLIAYPALWNAALSDADIATLAAGAHPSTVEPGSQVALWTLTTNASPEPDSWGANQELTLTGAPPFSPDDPIATGGRAFLLLFG